MKSEEITRLINNLKEQIRGIDKSDMNEVSWGYEEGVIISGNEAKIIIKVLGE